MCHSFSSCAKVLKVTCLLAINLPVVFTRFPLLSFPRVPDKDQRLINAEQTVTAVILTPQGQVVPEPRYTRCDERVTWPRSLQDYEAWRVGKAKWGEWQPLGNWPLKGQLWGEK